MNSLIETIIIGIGVITFVVNIVHYFLMFTFLYKIKSTKYCLVKLPIALNLLASTAGIVYCFNGNLDGVLLSAFVSQISLVITGLLLYFFGFRVSGFLLSKMKNEKFLIYDEGGVNENI